MAKRVFIVEVSFSLPVWADSEQQAEQLAEEEYAREEIRENGMSAIAESRAWELREPGEWGPCLPWGGDGERTIRQLLTSAASAASAAPQGLPTGGSSGCAGGDCGKDGGGRNET